MTGGGEQAKPISLFYSYSHRDEELRDRLEDHLGGLRWRGLIQGWHDRGIGAGREWKDAIDEHLATADIILLLVSSSFINSDYCWDKEMTKALERHDRGEARVIPVVLKPCYWQESPFARLQMVPRDAKPITSWRDPDEAFVQVVQAIRRAVDEIRLRRSRATPSAPPEPAVAAQPPIAATAIAREEPVRGDVRASEAEALRAPSGEATPNPPAAQQRVPSSPAERERVGALADFPVFRDVDASWCPEMVLLPAGGFLRGSPDTDRDASDGEKPQHRVTIGYRFAIGRYAVTFAEYDHFCEVMAREKPGDSGWGRGRRPVINVNWEDAKVYCAWLAKETGKPYRLPTEAEWEYACRAGTTTRYSCGDSIAEKDGNFLLRFGGKTSEVGAYPPNPWGLYDMHGNVWEWVEDVYYYNYHGAPTNGSAWTDGSGNDSSRYRVIRGGTWGSGPMGLRSADRNGGRPHVRDNYQGFRVARGVN